MLSVSYSYGRFQVLMEARDRGKEYLYCPVLACLGAGDGRSNDTVRYYQRTEQSECKKLTAHKHSKHTENLLLHTLSFLFPLFGATLLSSPSPLPCIHSPLLPASPVKLFAWRQHETRQEEKKSHKGKNTSGETLCPNTSGRPSIGRPSWFPADSFVPVR